MILLLSLKMTNRLELNWELDGVIDEQHYYCSTSPMNVESLPVPKVILANDVRSYIDTDIIEGQLYYVRVGSAKNGVVKLSNEISISTEVDQYWSNVVALLHFDNNLTDEKGSTWTISGAGLSYTDSISGFGKKLTKEDITTGAVTCSNNTLGDLAHDDFTIEFNFVLPLRANNLNYPFAWLLATDDIASTGVRGWQIAYSYEANIISFASSIKDINGAVLDYAFLSHNTISLDTKHHLAVTRLDDTFKLFIDGVLVAQATKHATMDSGQPIFIGMTPANTQTRACFSIDELRITKGVARYTANFTPPVEPFLNL